MELHKSIKTTKKNIIENQKRIKHTYQIGDKVLKNIKDITKANYSSSPFKGPYSGIQGNNYNRTVIIQNGK